MNKIALYIASVTTKNSGKNFFDRLMIERIKISHCEVFAKHSKLLIELPLLEEWLNSGGSLHGGAISTIIDLTTSMAIAALDDRHSVSVDLSVSFINALKLGSHMEIEATCHKLGKTLAFTSAEIRSNGNMIASGKHTKCMLNTKWSEKI